MNTYAGRPIRQPEREFAKKKVMEYGWQDNGKSTKELYRKLNADSIERPHGDPTRYDGDNVAQRIFESGRGSPLDNMTRNSKPYSRRTFEKKLAIKPNLEDLSLYKKASP